ncbi:MAG: glycosyltransferase family 4 protein [Flavobacteriales bacterium]
MPRILFIAAHRPGRSPSQRYRFEQFVPYWERHGYTFDYAWLIDAEDDKRFYAPGNLSAKAGIFLKSLKRRTEHVRRAAQADLVLVQREAFMTGTTRFERALARTGKPFVFDFDDAIWHLDVSAANRRLSWLKAPGKTAKIIGLADQVIAGNDYLADHARRYNPVVVTIPTVIDTDVYRPLPAVRRADGKLTIGWTGSYTSLAHLQQVLPLLRRLNEAWKEKLVFRVISDRDLYAPGLEVENVRWSAATEAEDLAAIDIGIMPLPDNEWSRGKCGFKGLQYMGMGRPVVLSRVGVNKTIVCDGKNGFLAGTDSEWLEKLGHLIADDELRRRMGRAARATVEQQYSVPAWRDAYLEIFNTLIRRKRT